MYEYSAQELEEGASVDGMAEKGSYEDQEEAAGKPSDYNSLGEENADMKRKETEEPPDVLSDTKDADILHLHKPKNRKTTTSHFHESPLMTLAYIAHETCTPMPLPEPAAAVALAPYTDENQWCLVNKFAVTTATVSSYVKPTDEKDKYSQIILKSNTTYKFRVAAVNSVGQSEWSENSTFKTSKPGFPGAPYKVKIVQSIVGAHMSWQPPPIISGNIIEYSVYLAVDPLRTINAGASTSATPVHLEALQMTFELVYRGPVSQCIILNATLSKAQIDTTRKPAIIFRVAARNMKGYGPSTQVRWLQEPTPTVIVPPLFYTENSKPTKEPLRCNVELMNEPVAINSTKKPVAARNKKLPKKPELKSILKPPKKPELKSILKPPRMPFVKAVKKLTNMADAKGNRNLTRMPFVKQIRNSTKMLDIKEFENPIKEIMMTPKEPGPRFIMVQTKKPFSRALVDTTKMSNAEDNVKTNRLPSNRKIAEITRLQYTKENVNTTKMPVLRYIMK